MRAPHAELCDVVVPRLLPSVEIRLQSCISCINSSPGAGPASRGRARTWPQVRLNRGLDFVALDDALVDARLPPEALEVPVPRCLLEHREPELRTRAALLARVAAQYGHAGAPEGLGSAEGAGSGPGSGGPLALAEALEIIAANERGRQGRARFGALRAARAARRLEARRKESGTVRAWLRALGLWERWAQRDRRGSWRRSARRRARCAPGLRLWGF